MTNMILDMHTSAISLLKNYNEIYNIWFAKLSNFDNVYFVSAFKEFHARAF